MTTIREFLENAGQCVLLVFFGIFVGIRFVVDWLYRKLKRTYRDNVQLRRPITPTDEEIIGSASEKRGGLFSSTLGSSRRPRSFRDQNQSGLFKLPAELRQKIWEELLSGRTVMYVGNRKKKMNPTAWRAMASHEVRAEDRPLAVALLGTCKRVYLETMPLLYQSNTFELIGAPFDVIPARRLSRISRLKFYIRTSERSEWIVPFSEFLFYERPQLGNGLRRLRNVPNVDIVVKARVARPEHDWLERKERYLLGLMDRAWKEAPGHLKVTVDWKLTEEMRQRTWPFEIVEAPTVEKGELFGVRRVGHGARIVYDSGSD